MNEKTKKATPLIALILITALCGGALAAWYWTSQTVTHTITVEGWITGVTNFMWADLEDGPSYDALSNRTIGTLWESPTIPGTYNQLLLVDGTNAETLFMKLNMVVPSGASATAHVYLQEYVVGTGYLAPTDLGTIAVDGSQSLQLIRNSTPLWASTQVYGTNYHVIKISYTFDQGTLGIGSWPFEITVSLGDDL